MAREKFVPYKEALDGFADLRKELNKAIEKNDKSRFDELFSSLKVYSANENAIAMDVLAYYYKTGVPDMLPENYMRYICWELLACSRGNQFAIEKIQFLVGYACEMIMNDPQYDLIEYKNDIENDDLYVIGKALAKILTRDYLQVFPIDLYQMRDIYQPYTQEAFVNLRKVIDYAAQDTLNYLKK